jgi:hypothetical protein
MRTSSTSEEQVIGFFGGIEVGMPIKRIGRKHSYRNAWFDKWRSKPGCRGVVVDVAVN